MQYSEQKRGQVRLHDASAKSFGRLADAINGTNDIVEEFVPVIGATVCEVPLGLSPDAFVRIQGRCIGRQILQMQARMPDEDVLNELSFVSGGIIEQNNDGTPEVAEELPEEYGDFIMADVVEEEEIVQTQALASGTD
jgi:hypothetical protein